jgi:hypothetical protein
VVVLVLDAQQAAAAARDVLMEEDAPVVDAVEDHWGHQHCR